MNHGLLQVVNDFIKHNGSSQGGSFFLGARYSFAEAMTAPFLQREVLLMPHVKKWDLVQYAKTAGLDRLVAWIEVSKTLKHRMPGRGYQ